MKHILSKLITLSMIGLGLFSATISIDKASRSTLAVDVNKESKIVIDEANNIPIICLNINGDLRSSLKQGRFHIWNIVTDFDSINNEGLALHQNVINSYEAGNNNKRYTYFYNEYGWSGAMYAYRYNNDNDKEANWPGKLMSFDSSIGLYFIDYTDRYEKIIFNNGSTDQTANLDLPHDFNNAYTNKNNDNHWYIFNNALNNHNSRYVFEFPETAYAINANGSARIYDQIRGTSYDTILPKQGNWNLKLPWYIKSFNFEFIGFNKENQVIKVNKNLAVTRDDKKGTLLMIDKVNNNFGHDPNNYNILTFEPSLMYGRNGKKETVNSYDPFLLAYSKAIKYTGYDKDNIHYDDSMCSKLIDKANRSNIDNMIKEYDRLSANDKQKADNVSYAKIDQDSREVEFMGGVVRFAKELYPNPSILNSKFAFENNPNSPILISVLALGTISIVGFFIYHKTNKSHKLEK